MGRKLVGDRTAKARLEEMVITESKFADDAALFAVTRKAVERVAGSFVAIAMCVAITLWHIEVFIGNNESDCSSIKEFNVETSKMLEEIMPKGDPVVAAILLTSIVDSNCMDSNIVNREFSFHYYDSSIVVATAAVVSNSQ